MTELVYPRERTLGAITLAIGILGWAGLLLGTFGVVLIALLLGFLLYLFAQSALIAHIRGNGVELTAAQFPDLHAQYLECVDRLQMKKRPNAYLMNGNGALNAFATQFLRTDYVVLHSDVVDAMEKHVDGVRFYFGHELGHLHRKHLGAQFLRWPALWLPLLGAAYSRARESTCDLHGRACCGSAENAARALSLLAAGSTRWADVSLPEYARQARDSKGFWMSFHELISGYPWLAKRAVRMMDAHADLPRRNPFAYLFAALVPYAGRLGAAFGFAMLAYVGILSAVALPAYQDYVSMATVNKAFTDSAGVREALVTYYQSNRTIPESLDAAGAPSRLADGSELRLDSENMALTVVTRLGELIEKPVADEHGDISWVCVSGERLNAKYLPPACRSQ